MTKRIMAGLLCLVLLFSAVPVTAFAASTGQQAGVDTGDVSIEGTNGFGTLLSQEITESQTETAQESADYEAGYTVTDLTIEGTTATVTYDSLEEALLVVALYTEDGMQMLTSATAAVTADATEATVEFTGEMPEYFLASAYLMDTYDLSPLCAAYDTPMYTQEMQELLASTVEDYDADRVLNLDDDNTTNFAVYAETTKVIEAVEGVNTVASIDDENATYVIGNADEQITTLTAGDVFVYPYAENEILIVKVDTIVIEGSTVTITGAELEMEEAFSHVKIDDNGKTGDFEVDDSTPVEGVTYEGMSDGRVGTLPASDDYSDTYEDYLKFNIDLPLDKTQPGMVEGELKIVGSVELNLTASMEYYKTDSRTFFSFKVDTKIVTALTVEAEIKTEIPLPPLKYRNVGLAIGFDPEFQVEVNGKVIFSATSRAGFALFYTDDKGLAIFVGGDILEKDFSVECELFFGIDLNPVLEVAEGWILSLEVEIPIGFQFNGKFTGTDIVYESTDAETHHGCKLCLGVDVYFEAGVKAELEFVKGYLPAIEGGESFSWYLFSFYYSFTNQSLGLGECPFKTYRVTFQVKDSSGTPVEGAEIFTAADISLGTTDRNGLLVTYLKEGNYEVHTTISEEMVAQTVDVKDACKVTLTSGTEDSSPGGILGDIDSDSIEDGSYIIASGMVGADGDNIKYELTADGVLTLSGSGEMMDFGQYGPTGYWVTRGFMYEEKIKHVIIEDGITYIGSAAFWECKNLSSVSIPDSVKWFGEYAFCSCTSLYSVTIPDSVLWISDSMFEYCHNLSDVTIPEGVFGIDSRAFSGCAISSITIPDSVTYINGYAFSYCPNLRNISIPDSVTWIGKGAFSQCDSLITIDLPKDLESIEENLFYSCDNLISVAIPDKATSIGEMAFTDCTSLRSVTVPASVTSIAERAFYECPSLVSIKVDEQNPNYSSDAHGVLFDKEQTTLIQVPGGISGHYSIPASVTNIGIYAFYSADNLTSVRIGDSVTTIGDYAFSFCNNLTNVTIPVSVTTIGDYAFHNYSPYNLSDIYYGGSEEQWAQISIGIENSPLNKATIHYNSTGPVTVSVSPMSDLPAFVNTASEKPIMIPDAVYPGDYSTEITDTYTLKTASFTGLVPSEQYVLLAMKSIEVEDPLASDNLLFIDQGVALEDGTLSFQYVQRESADISYVVACGASNKNLKDAEITFPEMASDGQLQVVDPTVVYDGVTLTEGRDYVIVGTVDYSTGGTYTCYVRGIHNYTGLVACEYTVAGAEIASGWSGATTWVLTDDGVLTFSGSGNMKNYGYGGGQPWEPYFDRITTVVIEDGVTAVGSGAFRNMTKLESVTLPASGLNKIGEAAFYGCTGLRELYIPDGVYTIWEYTFKNCPALTSIRLPATLVKIDQGAFEACTGLTELFIPGQTEIIGAWSFKGCTGLTAVDMQWADATEIRAGAFKNCTALTDVVLPGDIQILGDSAFYGIGAEAFTVPATVKEVGPWCFARAAVKEVRFEGDAPTIGEGAFNKITLTAFYPAENATWTSDIMQNYGGNVTWMAR